MLIIILVCQFEQNPSDKAMIKRLFRGSKARTVHDKSYPAEEAEIVTPEASKVGFLEGDADG